MSGDISIPRISISMTQPWAENLIQDTGTFFLPMVNKEGNQFIIACAHCQLVNLCYYGAQQLLHIIDPDNPFDVIFTEFWEPGDIPDQDGSCKILTCLDLWQDSVLGQPLGSRKIHNTRLNNEILETSLFHLVFQKLLLRMQTDFFLEWLRIILKRPY